VNNGLRFPALKFVTVPPPPLSTNHVHGGNPVCKQTCKRLSVKLKYCVPGSAPLTSTSVYARAPSNGTLRFRLIAGGMIEALIACVVPVIVKFCEKHGVVAAGQTCTVKVLPDGVMVLLSGTASPENDPVPSSGSGTDGTVVFMLNGVPF
jgi:hypothetical protein